MKTMKRALALLMVMVLAIAMVPTVFAAGETVTNTVSLTFTNVFNANGSVSVSGDGVEITSVSVNPGSVSGNSFWYAPGGTPELTNVTVNVSVKGTAGTSVTVTATAAIGVKGEDGLAADSSRTLTKTITLKKSSPSGPSKPSKEVDYSELERQIAIANGLNQAEYTKESWEALEEALANGMDALKSKSQEEVDAAAKALADAIAALVKMDYSALEAALAAVQEFIDGEDLADLWVRLVQAFLKGKELLTSGDQEACNATASEIMSILEELKARLEELRTPEVVTQQVEVEVMPKDDFCNIPLHKLWPILFFVSLVLNVVLVVVIVVIVSKKKNNAKDKTPLVDYDIGDDA